MRFIHYFLLMLVMLTNIKFINAQDSNSLSEDDSDEIEVWKIVVVVIIGAIFILLLLCFIVCITAHLIITWCDMRKYPTLYSL